MNYQIGKKVLIIILLSATSILSAQSFQDNSDYRMSLKLKIQSEAAFEDGSYEESTRLANESISYAKKSDKWIEMMLNKYRANSILKKVKKQLDAAKRLNAKTNYPQLLIEGTSLYNQANQLYSEKDYLNSYPIAKEAFNILKDIKYVAQQSKLPAAYLVMDLPEDEDCLWKIAEYDFIFGDPLKWELIYEANKDILPESTNPDLITIGLVLKIPSINGEKRSGTWINGSIN